jgi:4-diphosphocytidyl-2-C-methyl-D-erythritol kinase
VKYLSLCSFAKLNLYLGILGKLPRNYHSLITLFERVSLADQIRLKLLPHKQIRLSLSGFPLPKGRSNLVYRAASLLQKDFDLNQGVQIRIKKNIPVGAGLGGGSSNAATVLLGLNKLWKLNLRLKDLVSLGRRIGVDVPFFLYDHPFALGTLRGDKIRILRLPVRFWHIIVVPRIKVLSSSIYRRWDSEYMRNRKTLMGLTSHKTIIRILTSALLEKDLFLAGRLLFNSLEPVGISRYPVIGRVKTLLSNLGVQAISMSGSGPCVFGLTSSRKEAYTVARKLEAKSGNWDVFVARTV